MNDKAQEKSAKLISNQDIPIDIDQKDPPQENKDSPPEKPIFLFHKHYNCSQHDHGLKSDKAEPVEGRELWECDTYRFEFNLSVFIKCLLISTFEILGLKVLLYLYERLSGSKFLDNFSRLGMINGFIGVFGWINMVLVIFSIYEKEFIYSDAISLNYMAGLFFVSIIGASKMSFVNNKVAPLLETVKLSERSCEDINYLENVSNYPELARTMLRLNIDASSFFMSFLEEIPAESKAHRLLFLPKPQKDPVQTDAKVPAKPKKKIEVNPRNKDHQYKINEEEDRLVLDQSVTKPDFLWEALKFEQEVGYYKFDKKPSGWEIDKAYGKLYASNVLDAPRPKYPYAGFLLKVGLIGTIVVSFMRFDTSEESSVNLNLIIRYIVKGVLLLLNAAVTFGTLYLISEGTEVIWNRLCLVKGLTDLISEEAPPEDSICRRWNSMINIFDFESLRTWASIRMIFMNMDQRRLEAISLGISVITAIQLAAISVLGYFYFTAEDLAQKAFFLHYIIFFGTLTIIYMIHVLLFIYIGSQVNNQYQEHIYLMKTLKITINKLYASYPTYAANSRVQPSTYLFARGLRYLEKSFEGQEVTSASLKDNLETLNNAYDTIITELEIEEQFHPLTLLGIPMTDSFAGTVFTTILTVILVPVTKYFAEITGWD